MNSRPLNELDCRTKSFLIAICLSDEDVAGLAEWDEVSRCNLSSAGVWRRNYVHSACRADTELARRLSDTLDLRYADNVLSIRCSAEDEVRDHVRETLEQHRTGDFAPLLWALVTDARPRVQGYGQHVLAECFVAGCRSVREAHRRGKVR